MGGSESVRVHFLVYVLRLGPCPCAGWPSHLGWLRSPDHTALLSLEGAIGSDWLRYRLVLTTFREILFCLIF